MRLQDDVYAENFKNQYNFRTLNSLEAQRVQKISIISKAGVVSVAGLQIQEFAIVSKVVCLWSISSKNLHNFEAGLVVVYCVKPGLEKSCDRLIFRF